MEVTSKASYDQPKTGYVKAVCLKAADGRYAFSEYNGKKRWSRRVFLIFEIEEKITRGEEKYIGKNKIVTKEYTLSSSPDSLLRQDLEHWRGSKFGERLNPNGTITLMTKKLNPKTKKYEDVVFQIEELQGKNCVLKLEDIGKNKSYIAITEICQLKKDEKPIERENPLGYLPDGLARKIEERPITNPDELVEPINNHDDLYLGESEDEYEVPF